MPRLFLKLFGTFWLTTVLILSISIFASFRLSDKDTMERLIDPREIDASVREVVDDGGLAALQAWIGDSGNFLPGQTVYVVDKEGTELLGRTVPTYLERRVKRIFDRYSTDQAGEDRRDRTRTYHGFTPILETSDGSQWLAIPGPVLPSRFGILSSASPRWLVLGLAAATSLLTFWLLSRSLSRPARRIADVVGRFAAGDLTARVGSAGTSNDEIGEIGQQFDRMAARIEAETKSRAELFRNVSHELRAPLSRLQIAAELLKRKPSQANEQLVRICSEIEVLDALTVQVLSLARASQSGDRDHPVALSDVIGRIVNNAQLEAADKKISLDCALPDDEIVVQADEILLGSALENVVRNAIQATPAGGRITIITQVDAGRCTVTVGDSGPGVPDDDLARIFEPFYRLDTNRAGSGIGLAITARVMEQIGGSATAQNGERGGLVVTLEMPVVPR